MARTRGLGPRVVLHLAGRGEQKTRPIRVKGSSLVLYFEPAETGRSRWRWCRTTRIPPEGDALIEVDGGGLSMIRRRGAPARFPPGADAALRAEGARRRPAAVPLPPGGTAAARPADVSRPGPLRGRLRRGRHPEAARLRLNETVLVSGKSAVHLVGGGARLLLRQSVVLSSDDAFHFEPGETAKARLDVQCLLEQTDGGGTTRRGVG